ncbi:MAG: transcription factor FapR [Firmicutes bacterium]|nr:transcription factor FapR [Bacillota bacterium]
MSRKERRETLARALAADPFLTDDELAHRFRVSVQTIRLDRAALQIPELRQRLRNEASRRLVEIKPLGRGEIVGDLLELEPGKKALSLLEVTSDMVFRKSRIARGYHLFAQAHSLALALIDSEVVLTGIGKVKYRRPVYTGERLLARAEVVRCLGHRVVVQVNTTVDDEPVLTGTFMVSTGGRSVAG